MARWSSLFVVMLAVAWAASPVAQRAPQTRPPLFLSEGWKALPAPPDDHGAWPASQQGVASPNLQLTLHGASGKEIQLVAVRGNTDLYPMNLWTGTTTSPTAATLRDRTSYVDLTDPLAKIRWTVRTSGFHQVRPVVKLADGTWLVGDHATGPELDFNQTDVSIADLRWLKLDIDRVVAVGNWIDRPDLSRVDEVGFADLMPGSGHGPGGYVNVGRIEVYGKPVKRANASARTETTAPETDEAEVLKLDQRIADAVVRGDTAFVTGVTPSDFVMVHGDGWTNGGKPLRTDTQASMLGRVTGKYYDVIAFDSVKAEMHGDVAITYGRYLAHTNQGGDAAKAWFAVWFERVYAKRAGRWTYLSHRTVHGPTYGTDRASVQGK